MDKSDFDELDRAVQSLVPDSSAPRQNSSPTNDQPQSVSQPDPIVPAAPVTELSSPVSEPIQQSEPAASTAPAQTTPQRPVVAQRPRGRFMDIVPPRKDTARTATAAPSRSGISLTPPTDKTSQPPVEAPAADIDKADPEPVFDTEEDAPVAQPVEDIAAKPAPVQTEDVPAPSAQAETQVEDKLVDLAQSEATDLQDDFDKEIAELVDLDEDDNQSTASPFISGANVDKRPLGKEPTPGQSDEVAADPVDTIEKEPDTSPANPQDNAPLPEQPKSQPEKPARNKMKGAKVSPAPADTSGPTSIAQQYKVQPDNQSAESASTSSMYDAENYTQPLAHPAKKKSGWLGVFWIVLLLAVGGGGAFIAYQLQLF